MEERVVFVAFLEPAVLLEEFCERVEADDAYVDGDGNAVLEFDDGSIRVAIFDEEKKEWVWAE